MDCGTETSAKREIALESANEDGENFRIAFEVNRKDFDGRTFPVIPTADYRSFGTTEEGSSYSKRFRVLFQKMPAVIKEKEFKLVRNSSPEGYGFYKELPFAHTYKNKRSRYLSLLEPRYVQVEHSEGGKLETTPIFDLSEREQGLARFTSRMVFEAYLHCRDEHKRPSKAPVKADKTNGSKSIVPAAR